MKRVFIALGSNLGDRMGNCRRALELIASTEGVTLVKTSSFYETEPWGGIEQGPFINAVAEVSTDLAPEELLRRLKAIETEAGRTGTARWGPREMDLDILFYNDAVISSAALTVPHPRLHERAFVLVPLSEIAPGFVHPVLRLTVAELAKRSGSKGVRRIDEGAR